MELRPLGRTRIDVSVIGLGTVKLGRNTGVKYPAGFALPTDEQAAALLRRAAELGVNLIDTAPAYGTSEERLGAIMHANGWFGGRGRGGWVVSTKVGEEFDGEPASSRYDFSEHAVRSSIYRSLLRLGTEYLDIVLIHSDGQDVAVLRGEALGTLKDLKARGHVRAVGISTKTVEGTLGAIEAGCDTVMVTLNPRETEQLPAIKGAHIRGVGILIKKGLLSGHVADLATFVKSDPAAATDPAGASIRFILRAAGAAVSSIVVGTTGPDHLTTNVRAAENVRSPQG